MKDYELATRREIEVALLNKGQESKRYRLGDKWELDYDEIREALDKLTSSHTIGYKDLIRTIKAGIASTNGNDAYSCGIRNGMRWCKALIEGKEPKYEKPPFLSRLRIKWKCKKEEVPDDISNKTT